MEFKEAKQCAEVARIYLQATQDNTIDTRPIKDEALVCLADRITELEALRDELQDEIDGLCSVESVIY